MKATYASATALGLLIGGALVLRAVITPRPASARAEAAAPARPSQGLIEPGARALPTPAEMSGWAAAGSSLD